MNNAIQNERLYQDPIVFGIIEEARDMKHPKKFRVDDNVHFTFGRGRIQRTQKNTEVGVFIADVSPDWTLEELHQRGLLPAFIAGWDAQR